MKITCRIFFSGLTAAIGDVLPFVIYDQDYGQPKKAVDKQGSTAHRMALTIPENPFLPELPYLLSERLSRWMTDQESAPKDAYITDYVEPI
jgi:hypothetical protein